MTLHPQDMHRGPGMWDAFELRFAHRNVQWSLADEFVIRYGVPWAYEPDLPVARQRELVEQVRARLDDPCMRFVDGDWYFQGRLATVGNAARWGGVGRRAKS